jgi:hypothetical protein
MKKYRSNLMLTRIHNAFRRLMLWLDHSTSVGHCPECCGLLLEFGGMVWCDNAACPSNQFHKGERI